MKMTEGKLEIAGRTISVSNLDKVMYPETGFTKGEVIDYYIKISPALLPHLKNRPLTMKRYPDGIHGNFFYEKNAPSHTPNWIKTTYFGRNTGNEPNRHILVNDLPTLVWSSNMANLELHTVLSRAPKFTAPTMMVFDLDPGPPAGILESAEVAFLIKEVLDSLNLESFAKTSGSKGVQVYVPLNTPTDFETTRGFAEVIALMLANQHPDRIVSTMSKLVRTGRVFIDWSQNAEHKTTASVYSLRASREIPSISMPVNWKELSAAIKKADADQLYFEPAEALQRVKKMGDLFEPVLTIKQKIPRKFQAPKQKVVQSKVARASRLRNSAGRRSALQGDRSLKAYEAKRDFTKTKEPAPGKGKVKRGKKEPMFVIQKHAARRLHYDFRLEMDGVLRSWAVPNGLPTELNDKRLAVHVEDHPMNYAKFEGIIPSGNYGAGTVMVWDIGTYTTMEQDPIKAYYEGKLHVYLHGEKLKGEWVLVKTKMREGDKDHWLLLKKGERLKPIGVKKDDQSVLTGRSMKKIASDNDAQWISNRPAS
ncbi:non-homologous end-joining DNA ligase [bacterium]|nr:non-homologous end-joining DNA ligase [bacterium]